MFYLAFSMILFMSTTMANEARVQDCSPDPYSPPDTCGHPYVGRIVGKVSNSDNFRAICSASLSHLSDVAVITTAAHCVESIQLGLYDSVMITFDSRAYEAVGGEILTAAPIITEDDIDLTRFVEIDEAILNPKFYEKLTYSNIASVDLGVLLIDEANTTKIKSLWPTIQPLPLAEVDMLDTVRALLNIGEIEATYAGYGHSLLTFHGSSPAQTLLTSSDGSRLAGKVGYLAHSPKGFIILEENANLESARIANGDSGSPIIVDGKQVGVISVYLRSVWFQAARTETPGALNFLCQYIPDGGCDMD